MFFREGSEGRCFLLPTDSPKTTQANGFCLVVQCGDIGIRDFMSCGPSHCPSSVSSRIDFMHASFSKVWFFFPFTNYNWTHTHVNLPFVCHFNTLFSCLVTALHTCIHTDIHVYIYAPKHHIHFHEYIRIVWTQWLVVQPGWKRIVSPRISALLSCTCLSLSGFCLLYRLLYCPLRNSILGVSEHLPRIPMSNCTVHTYIHYAWIIKCIYIHIHTYYTRTVHPTRTIRISVHTYTVHIVIHWYVCA